MLQVAVALLTLFAPSVRQSTFEPGVSLRIYNIGRPMDTLAKLVPGQTPNIDRRLPEINIPNGQFGLADYFIAELTGEFLADDDATYTFKLTSDDGSELSLDNKVVIDNDGVHAAKAVEKSVSLTKGWHKLVIRYFESSGGEELKLEWKGGSHTEYVVAGEKNLRCPAGLTRVTAPGTKQALGLPGKMRPGSGMPLEGLHPGWTLQQARPSSFKPQVGAMAFLPNGSLLVSNFKPNQSGQFMPDLRDGLIYRLDNLSSNDPEKIVVTQVASGIQEPLGLAVVESGGKSHVYLSQRNEISELIDADGDGKYESTKTVAKGWVSDNYHHFTFGLAAKDGYLYVSFSTSITFGAPGINGPNPRDRGTVIRVDPTRYDASKPYANIEVLTGGHRTPNGIEVGPEGLILVGENQGAWQPSDKINVVRPGAFYGHYNNTQFKTAQYPNGGAKGPFDEQPLEPPALHLPHNEAANSPAQSVLITNGPMTGQLLISDVKYGGLRRGFLEKVGDVWQGGVVPYSQGFEVGTNRMVWGPDGWLYIGGIGATESWAWTDPKTGAWTSFGLQRIKPNGNSVFEIETVKAIPTGFRVKFTKPFSKASLKSKTDEILHAAQWDYEPTPEYGGDKKHRESLDVASIKAVSSTELDVTLPGLKEERVVHLNFNLKSDKGEDLWATECWYTLNKIPAPKTSIVRALVKPNPRVLVFSKTTGFRHDSIPTAVDAVRKLGTEHGFSVVATEDSSVFTDANLAKFDTVVFLLTIGDVLNEAEKAAFEKFIRAGGGYVGVHSATDTEYKWPFYQSLVGAAFRSHPPGTYVAQLKIEDPNHPASVSLPNNWLHNDEWYNFKVNPRSNVRVLATVDESTYTGGDMGDHPVMWTNEIGKGRGWYTALGHTKESYSELHFLESLYQGILWVSQANPPVAAEPVKFKLESGWTDAGDKGFETPKGGSPDVYSQNEYGDCQLHVEFKIPEGSNSGVYLQGRYEVQIFDSFGKNWFDLKPSDCGGIYEQWINDAGVGGHRPLHNAFRGPDTWNSYDILFRAARFKNGKMVEKPRFVEVRCNGVVIQQQFALDGPTRGGLEGTKPLGPIRLQGDHGPVSYRNVWVKKLDLSKPN